MMVLDKRNQLQTLLGMGSSVNEIRQIFFYQGLLLSGVGGHQRVLRLGAEGVDRPVAAAAAFAAMVANMFSAAADA